MCVCFAGYFYFNNFLLSTSVACDGVDYAGGIFGAEWLGVTTFYEVGFILILAGWALLVCLFSVLVVVRGVDRGALRAVRLSVISARAKAISGRVAEFKRWASVNIVEGFIWLVANPFGPIFSSHVRSVACVINFWLHIRDKRDRER